MRHLSPIGIEKGVPDALRQAIEREGVTPEFDNFGPKLSAKLSDAVYVEVANFRRARYLEINRRGREAEPEEMREE